LCWCRDCLRCLAKQLADGAGRRGWDDEVGQHHRTSDRIHGLLSELGEPCAPPGDLD
jgi:hypothetical protein